MKRLLLTLVLLTAPGLAVADTPPQSDPVPADRYIERDAAPPHRGCGPTWEGERATADGRTHGDVAVGAGTDGSNAAALRLCAPIGDSGEVTISASRSEGGRWRGPHPDGRPQQPDDR